MSEFRRLNMRYLANHRGRSREFACFNVSFFISRLGMVFAAVIPTKPYREQTGRQEDERARWENDRFHPQADL
jgi:hypothetical protein